MWWINLWNDILWPEWQDHVATGTQFLFGALLIPTLMHPMNKPPFLTCIGTAVTLAILAFIFSTIPLWIATTAALVNGALWSVITWQRWRLNKNEKAGCD